MPWQELSPVNLRMHFVTDWQTGCWTMTELCADYQISRKTGYKWLERYETSGPARAARSVVGGRITARRRPIRRWSRRWWRCASGIRAGAPRNCSRSRGARIATRPGRVGRRCAICSRRAAWSSPRRRRDRPRPAPRSPLAPIQTVNEVWTTDFKGALSHGRWRVLLSADAARWLQSLRAALRRVGRADLRGHAAALRARVCRVWLARAHPQ